MTENKEMFWAFIFAIFLAACIASVGYIHSGPDNARQEIFQIANALVSGAMGFFAGRASIRPTQPETPAQPKEH